MSSTTVMTDRFNAEAATWDSNPVVVRSSELAYRTLLRHVPDLKTSKLNILEIGCGTGLLSFHLAPHAHTLLGVDLAGGMVGAFNAKLAPRQVTNLAAVETLLVDPDQPEVQAAAKQLLSNRALAADHGGGGGGGGGGDGDADADAAVRWDLVISHLTLHHIPEMRDALRTCFASLRPGSGRIALTDFEDFGAEAVWFHPASKRSDVERHGLRADEMVRLIEGAGFVDVRVERAFVLEKEVDPAEAGGLERMGFPFLICLGRRPE